MTKTVDLAILLATISFALGCGTVGPADPQPPTKIGVFADTGNGNLTELSAYAEELMVIGGGGQAWDTRKVPGVPVAGGVRAFFVNMTDITMTNSKVFLLGQAGPVFEARTPSTVWDPRFAALQPLRIEMERAGQGVYKLVVADLAGKKGLAALKIRIAPGTPDRLYLLRLE